MLHDVDKAVKHWSDLSFWKLTVVLTAVGFGLEHALHMLLRDSSPLAGRGRCFASSGAADLGTPGKCGMELQVYIINVV